MYHRRKEIKKKENSLLVVAVVDCYIQLEGPSAEEPRWHLDTVPGHYWVRQVKGKLVECHLTGPLTQGMCLVVVTVAAAGTVEAAAVVAEENKTKTITLKPLLTPLHNYVDCFLKYGKWNFPKCRVLKVLFCGF